MTAAENSLKNRQQDHYRLQAFILSLCAAVVMFVPLIIIGDGILFYYGDFNAQQIPFHMLCHRAVRAGDLFWSWDTDLGANFIGSYAFYVIGSPFFWLMLPFPTWFVPYLLGPLLILKFALAGLFAAMFIRRFVSSSTPAVIGGLLYAFSGFSLYNVFFNHFHEAIVFFPLLLIGLEKLMQQNRRGYFALAVALCAISNYFFFIAMAVFLIPYFLLRCFSGDWRVTFPKICSVAFESLTGVGIACILFLPAILEVLQNGRATTFLQGWDLLLYGNSRLYANIAVSPFLPAEMPSALLYVPQSEAHWASLSAYLPLFSTTGVIAYLCSRRGDWLRRLLLLCVAAALIPGLNNLFMLLNAAYYARWFFMPVLMMSLCTAIAIDRRHEMDWRRGWRYTALITVAMVLCLGLLPQQVTQDDQKSWQLGLFVRGDEQEQFWNPIRFAASSVIAVGSLILLRCILRAVRRRGPAFIKQCLAGTLACVVLTGCYMTYASKGIGFYSDDYFNSGMLQNQPTFEQPANYRTEVYHYEDNATMFWNVPGLLAFHSLVPASIVDYYEFIGVERSVSSEPPTDFYTTRTLLGVKYVADYTADNKVENYENSFINAQGDPEIYGFRYIRTDGNFDIYENTNYIGLGFVYDTIVSQSTVEQEFAGHRDVALLKAAMLSDEDFEKYKERLPVYQRDLQDVYLSKAQELQKDAQALRETAVTDFSRDRTGFEATCSSDGGLAFFSVPYHTGWSATVDGRPAQIIRTNAGFVSVLVDAGTHEIRFTFETPGLHIGLLISAVCAVLLGLYAVLCHMYRKRDDEVARSVSDRPFVEHQPELPPQMNRQNERP